MSATNTNTTTSYTKDSSLETDHRKLPVISGPEMYDEEIEGAYVSPHLSDDDSATVNDVLNNTLAQHANEVRHTTQDLEIYLKNVDEENSLEEIQEENSILDDIYSEEDLSILEQIAAYEIHPQRRESLIKYANALPDLQKIALLETLKGSRGATPKIGSLANYVETHIKRATNSRALQLRNKAGAEHLSHYSALVDRVSRVLQNDLSDTPLASLRIDGVKQHQNKLSEELHILAGAILAMQDLTLGEKILDDTYETAINVESLVKICTVIGYGVRSWAGVYHHHEMIVKQHKNIVKSLELEILSLQKTAFEKDEALAEQTKTINKYQDRTHSEFVICHSGGKFLSSTFASNEDNETFFSRSSLRVADTFEEAAKFTSLNDAKTVLYAMKTKWCKKHKMLKPSKLFKEYKPDDFYLATITVNKVE
jgi:hypothetical protein